MKKCLYNIAITFSVLVLYQSAWATIRYVKPTATGTADGTSWANASADLQGMINASASADEVWVAAGVYKPSADGSGDTNPADNRDKLFYMKDAVKLYGGFTGTETLLGQRDFSTNKTILSGDIDNNDTNTDGNSINESHTDIQGDNVYHVLVFPGTGESTEFDGFIITGGQNTTTTGYTSQNVGGYNFSSFRGSALYFSGAAPQIRNCLISGNNGYNGVLYQNNQNTSGGWTSTLENLIWVENYAYRGILYLHRGPTEVTNNVFASNSASSSVIYISSNMPDGNSINYNHLSVFNNSPGQYSNLFLLQGGTVQIKNSALWKEVQTNNALISNSAHSLTVSNSIIQGSGGSSNWNNGFGTDVGNNLDLAPQFSNAANLAGPDARYFTSDDGLIPSSCSPLINNASAGLTKDIAGQSRPNEGQNDIGAYEFQGISTLPDNPTSVSSSSYSITCGQTVTLSGSCSTGTLTWYGQAAGGNNVGTGNGLVVSPIENPAHYYASCETSATCLSLNRVPVPEITVSLPTNPTGVSVSENDICPNTVIDLYATCAGGTSPEWYDGSMSVLGSGTGLQVSPTSTTTYSVKCINGSCLSDAEELTVNVLARAINDDANPDNICAGQSVTYTANCEVGTVEWYQSYSGGSPLATGNSYTFTPSHGSSNYYRLYVACSNGTCRSSRSSADSYFYFASPSVTVSETVLCVTNNTEVTVTANCTSSAGGTVTNWYDAATGGNLLGSGNTFNHTPTNTIIYYAECVSNNYSCTSDRTATDEVVVGQAVTLPTSVSVNDTEVCANTDITLSANCSTGAVIWYTLAAGGSSIGEGQSLVHTVNSTSTYYSSCEDGSCISDRVATAEVTVLPSSGGIPMNQTLTGNITGSDTKQAIEYIEATNKVITPSNVVYESGKAINLAPGFEVENGSVFLGKADLQACP